MSDEHDPETTGCYGHQEVMTPALDGLAARGVLFDRAYCNSPICVPSRMSLLAGRYVHRIGTWDNGSPLASEIPTFATYLEAAGYRTALCGRMHMIGPDRLHGFGTRLYDDLTRWQSFDQKPIRKTDGRRVRGDSHVSECGPGFHQHQAYDATVSDLCGRFLRDAARREAEDREAAPGPSDGSPWLLVAGFMLPHFPLLAPRELFDAYDSDRLRLPEGREEPLESQHPAVRQIRFHHYGERPLPEEVERRALASYYALVTLMDRNIGRLLDIVETTALRDSTMIVYLSDHGEMAGRHGMWQKMCFYEPSVRVPLVVAGPGWPAGTRVHANVSLVDLLPTLLEAAGEEPPGGASGAGAGAHGDAAGKPAALGGTVPGAPLQRAVDGTLDPDRVVFSEYHAQGLERAGYMVKRGALKYNAYVGHPPQLFDLDADPGELHDLWTDPAYAAVRREMDGCLRSIVDPEEADRWARENQTKEGLARAT